MRCLILISMFLASVAFAQPRSPVLESIGKPVRAERKAEGHWFFDFGKDAFGNIEINVPMDIGPTTVTVQLGEALSSSNAVNPSPGGTVRYQKHELRLEAEARALPPLTWNPPGWMTSGWLDMPDGMPQVMPFRYVEVENAPDWFSVDHIRRISWSIPFDEEASSFHSSDEQLNGVWELCKYSIKATSFLGLYIDGDRERKPYEADALINQWSHYCVDQRYDTGRFTHEYLLENPTWPTEWRLQSVMLGWADFLWSGNDSSLRRHYDTLKSRAMLDRRTEDGLFRGYLSRGQSPWLEDIVDWPAGERDGYDMQVQVKSVVTAFHYHDLVLLEKIATQLGKPDDAERFSDLARGTYETFNQRLWDAEKGCYIDGLNPDTGEVSDHVSSHANFFPLALGLVPSNRVTSVAALLKSRGMVCSVYGAQFFLDALYDAGEEDYALSLLMSDQLRSWRNMSEKVGSTITLEAWDPSLKPNLDWNHAWGAAPANIIPRKLMGIEPLTPGFKRFRVRPQTGSLTEASVKLPTPQGPITLFVKQTTDKQWTADLEVPQGTTAEFHLPPHEANTLKLSSGQPHPLRIERGRSVIELPAGRHQLSLRKTN